jgi:creatinine amidohydrolase
VTESFDIPGAHLFAWHASPDLGAMAASGAVALVPVGAVEQHGPHLPVGLDVWVAGAVARAVAAREPGVLAAEPLAYGVSAHHNAFPGALTLRPATFIAVAVDVCRSLARNGFFPVLLNGHGGNRAALAVAVAELGETGVRAAAFSYFDLIAEEARAILPDADHGCGHACALETSLMMHLLPAAVRRERIPAGGTPPSWPDPHLFAAPPVSVWRGFDEINPTGVIGRPEDASAEAGARLFAAAVARSAEAVRQLRETFAGARSRGSAPDQGRLR